MKFLNIIEWTNYINEQPIENLSSLLTEDYNLYEYLEDETRLEIDTALLYECFERFKGASFEETFWSNTICFLHNDSFSEEIFDYLVSQEMAIITLCHLPLKDEFLWRLVDFEEEAILTLGKRYYTQTKYSLDDFKNLLLKFKTCNWLWRSLIDTKTDDLKKEKLFKRMIFRETDFYDYKVLLIEMAIENFLKVTSRVKLINKYYGKNNCRYFRGIAQNPNTPVYLLEELVQIKEMKYAKLIRVNALDNIKSRNKKVFL